MVLCAAKVCKSNEDTLVGEEKIRFFEFPSDETLRQRWEKVCKISSIKNNQIPVICQLHFDANCFDSNKQLKPDSVPKYPKKKRTLASILNGEPVKKKLNESKTTAHNKVETQNENVLANKTLQKKHKPYRLTVQIDKVYLRPCPKSKKSNQVKMSFGLSENIIDSDEFITGQSSDQNNLENGNLSQTCNQCLVCKKDFTIPTDLYNHLREHFTCNICQAEFTSKKSHSKHYKLHNTTTNNTTIIYPFKCDICSVSFETRDDFQNHKHAPRFYKPEVHKDSFYCNLCDKTFKNAATKRKHSKLHEEKKPNPVVKNTSLSSEDKEELTASNTL